MFIDTHTHLYLEEFSKDRKEVVERAIKAGVTRMFLPNIDNSTVEAMLEMTAAFPANCYPMIGLHPGSVKENYSEELEKMRTSFLKVDFIGIGEIGIDLYWDKTFRMEQEKAFEIQLKWAIQEDLPVVIHARDSFEEIFKVLDKVYEPGLRGVFHSFTGGEKEVDKIREYDFYYGINGIVTFKNSGLQDVVKKLPEDRILLETDSPYLSPDPKRGKRNESAYLVLTGEHLANVLGLSLTEMADITTRNANELFKIK